MRNKAHYGIPGLCLRTALGILCAALLCGTTYGQNRGGSGLNGGPCVVTELRLRIVTGGDDLRGGQDNLNIIVFFTSGSPQVAANVNKGNNWPNNSVNHVDIPLSRPVSPDEIKALRLVHIADGSFKVYLPVLILNAPLALAHAFQSPDNWNMAEIEIAGLGDGGGVRIAKYGFHRFTGSDPALTISTKAPPNTCVLGRLNPSLKPAWTEMTTVTGGSKYAVLKNDDVLRMAKSGVPEPTILARIRSNPTQFDMSVGEVAKLRQIGISENIVREMQNRNADPNNNPKARLNVTDGGKNADDLNPQPYPPKSKTGNQTLLPSSGQQTMLGTQADSPSGNQSVLIPAAQRPAITDGSLNGGTRLAGATQVGPSQTMSAPGNSRPSAVQQSGTVGAATAPSSGMLSPLNKTGSGMLVAGGTNQTNPTMVAPIAITANPNLLVAQACAKDPSFRILFVTGASDGKTLTVGPRYTVWGCSFGNMPGAKQPRPPAASLSQNQTTTPPSRRYSYTVGVQMTQPYSIYVEANTVSWSDNAVVVTFPPRTKNYSGSTAGLVLGAQVLVTRGDGQTAYYGQGQLYFRLVN
ncbi:MAG TPA: hypothetical protein VGR93_04840 [Candidatus Acidoferrales bacterium]|nr:hypothetical protein [Candidatus Acidoferrales bacterium]